MNLVDISRLDLNLLVVFQCLMAERSVTRSAAVLHLTQSAVSAALRRLREQFGDELFERRGRGMVPTRKALEVAPRVNEALGIVSRLLARPAEPPVEDSGRVFNVALSDDLESYLAPRLIHRVSRQKSAIGFSFQQTNSVLWKDALADEAIDLVLCAEPKELTARYGSQVLFSSSYSCLYDGPRLGLSSPLTREEYLACAHVRVSFDGRRGFVDDLFEREGMTRPVAASFTHFSGILTTLSHCRAIATIPTFAALAFARAARLTVSPVPMHTPAFRVFMIWRTTGSEDTHNRWLRNFLAQTVQAF